MRSVLSFIAVLVVGISAFAVAQNTPSAKSALNFLPKAKSYSVEFQTSTEKTKATTDKPKAESKLSEHLTQRILAWEKQQWLLGDEWRRQHRQTVIEQSPTITASTLPLKFKFLPGEDKTNPKHFYNFDGYTYDPCHDGYIQGYNYDYIRWLKERGTIFWRYEKVNIGGTPVQYVWQWEQYEP